ncbi:MAG: NAD(P)-dependent oxidoreductase [Nitrososphaerota archaeon]|nr:NAD(P)-dependent oxidoreductase [Nitrososphaerota archaeon]
MKILLTGATGFIGSHLAPKLEEQGHDVYTFERYVTGRPATKHKFKTVFGDLRDYLQVSRAVKDVQPQAIIHLAAISPVSYSYENPFDVQEVNYIGTVHLAEAALRNAPFLGQFIFASTSESYGNIQPPMRENNEQLPNSPYSASKVASEKYLRYLHVANSFPITIMRAFNTYGRKTDHHFFIENMITQMLRSNVVKLGEKDAVRDFMYVDDHVNGYLSALGKKEAIGRAINFCTGVPYKLTDIVEIAKEITGFTGDIIWNTIPRRPYDISQLWGINTLAEELLGWKPTIPLHEGLKFTAEYWDKVLPAGKIQ